MRSRDLVPGPGVGNVTRDRWGQLTPASCDSTIFNHTGYLVADAGGPWSGQSLVAEKNVAVTLLKSLRPDLYQTAPKHARPAAGNTYPGAKGGSWATKLINGCNDIFPPDTTTLTAWQVNKECGESTDFSTVVSKVDEHEDQHATDILNAVNSQNITSHWDTLLGTQAEVERLVEAVLTPAISIVEAAARRADQTGDGDIGWLWRWSKTNDGWLWYLVHRAHN